MHPMIEKRPGDFYLQMYQNMFFPDHLHRQIEILIPLCEKVEAEMNGKKCSVAPGEALFVFPHQIHGYPQENDSSGIMILFDPLLFPTLGVDWGNAGLQNPVLVLNDEAEYALQHLIQDVNKSDYAQTAAHVHLLAAGLLRDAQLVSLEKPARNDLLYAALDYLSDHFADPEISLKKTAREIGVNEYYLSHLLNLRLQMSFRSYINVLRMEQARELLLKKNISIEEAAAQSGFGSLRSFDRVFSEVCGCTPREYRNRH